MSDKSYEVDFGDSGLTGAEEERLMRSGAGDAERAQEAALRPKGLAEFVGQKQVREQLSLVLDAAKAGERTPDHVLLSGPPGLGKTTLAMIIAQEMGSHIRITSGPAVQHAGDLAAILSSLDEGEVLFIDEIHRVARAAEEMLYVAMEDFRVDVIVGKGPGGYRDSTGSSAVYLGGGYYSFGVVASALARPFWVYGPLGFLHVAGFTARA